MPKSPHINKIRTVANGLLDIPANEQCIGHLQMALKDALLEIADELERQAKLLGVG